MALDLQKAKEFISKVYDESAIPTLCKYVEIPNQSPAYDAEWATNGYMDKAIDLIVDWVKGQNVPNTTIEVIRLQDRTPLIFIEVSSTSDAPTVLLYGHMDKQPPLTETWSGGFHPYKPIIKDGKLYGRGGADDGYSTFSSILAIKALKEQGVAHPRCVILIEAREESGSQDLPAYVEHLKDRIGSPTLIICLDSGCGNYEQFWMTSSLRGCIMGTLNVQVLKEAVHSGQASGIVPSSFRVIRQLLNRIEDADTGKVLVPSLSKEIPKERIQQQSEAASILGKGLVEEFPWMDGTQPMHNDLVELLLNRSWRATISYTGIGGIPSLERAGNVLRTESSLKISVRVPPHVDPNEAANELKQILEKDPPYGCKVTFGGVVAMPGWASPLLSPWLEKAIGDAGMAIFGKKHAYLGEGGSIPFMGMLGKQFPNAQFVITGILGPGSNAHGPNEFLHINMCKNVTTVVSHILAQATHQ